MADTRANPSRWRENDKEPMTTDTSGRTSPPSFATLDPSGSSWRTSQVIFPWDSGTFSEIWPKWGSMRSGVCSLRPASAPPISESASSLLPTPDAAASNDGETPASFLARQERVKAKGYNANGMGTPLAMEVKLLPTVTAMDANSAANATSGRQAGSRHHSGTTLTDVVKLLPTPTTSDAKGPSPSHDRTLAEALDTTRPGRVPGISPPSTAGPGSSDEEPLHLW